MGSGVLKKGLYLVTSENYTFDIPKNTRVLFQNKTIAFPEFPSLKIFVNNGSAYLIFYDRLFRIVFDKSNPPYPISYYLNNKVQA
jgi:hypothetical protein